MRGLSLMIQVLGLFALASRVDGHATLVVPDPRAQDGNLWYQVGCIIGCTCSGFSSKELYKTPETFGCKTPMEPTNNDPATRTWNVQNKSSQGDWAKYTPWRAPGHATPLNGCGVASGYMSGGFERVSKSGQKQFYDSDIPAGYEAGAPGTSVPKVAASVAVWVAGETAEVSFAIDVNHGGGYQYRLCPKSSGEITEECFQTMPLSFASKTSIIHHQDKSRGNISIPAVDVTAGVKPAGVAWRRFPVPACNCDLGTGCYVPKATSGRGSSVAYDDLDTSNAECPTGLQFAKSWDEGYGYYGPRNTQGGKNGKSMKGKGDSGKSKGDSGKDMYSDVDLECKKLDEDECTSNKACAMITKGGYNYCWGKNVDGVKKAGGARKLSQSLLQQKQDEQVDDDEDVHEHRMLAVGDGTYKCSRCGYVYDPSKHEGKAFEDQPEDWHCPVCQSAKSKFQKTTTLADVDKLGTTPKEGYGWHIVDHVIVPKTPGDYVLSWRWDCEQTPQVWTNCADVTVVDKANEAASTTDADPQASEATASTAGVLMSALVVLWAA